MKSVKTKLFASYVAIFFAILLFLTMITIYFFNLNQKTSTQDLINDTFKKIQKYIAQNKPLKTIDENIELQNLFLLIFEKNKLVFSNQSNYNTQKILSYLRHNKISHIGHHHKKLNLQIQEGTIYTNGYILQIQKSNQQNIKILLGINQIHLNDTYSSIYIGVIVLNIIIFLILSILGYFLINNTIKPLKLILNELNNLQKEENLSKRLKPIKTNDEFEKLVNSFNKMLEKIENSIEGVKQFSSDVSHELRTPLTVIQGELDLLKSKDITLDNAKTALHVINKEQKKLQEIIKNFLLLSRLEKENIQIKTSLLDKVLLEEVELNLDNIEKKNIKLNLSIDENLKVNIDEKYLQIIINNLLTNAIKYTKKGFISLEAKKKDNKIVLHVKDSGIGISKEDSKKIFERFYRADYARSEIEGLGLGLSIVKKICDRYSCKIKTKSNLNEGSCFTLEFILANN